MTGKKPGKPKGKAGPTARALAKSAKAPSVAASGKAKPAAKLKPARKIKDAKPAAPKANPPKAAAAALLTQSPIAPYALRQVAALPLRRTQDGLEVLLITSRETHRWVIPKGWPMRKKSDADAAATEALEEAGLLGVVHPEPIGAFPYFKRREEYFDLVDVAVYRLDVTGQEETWREQDQREQRWCGLEEAARLVQEPGLKTLLRDLAERL